MTTTRDIRRIYKALVMNPISADRVDFYDPGYLVVADDRIERLQSEDPRAEFPEAEFHDLSGFAILPGFVDTHVHLPQFAIMGIGSNSLLEWLKEYTYPEEMRFSDPDYAKRISDLFVDALVANGTTAAVIYCSVHERATDIAFESAQRADLRAFIGKTMMDRNAPQELLEDMRGSVSASIGLHQKWDGANDGRLRYIFTPRFAGSSSMDLMRRVATVAGQMKAFIQSHLSENEAEVAWIRSLFPQNTSYTDVYDSAGILGSRTIMGHCIHLSPDEISTLVRTQTNVAFCPYSNRALRSGIAPYAQWHQAGLKIALGTDIAGGPSLSMFRQMGEALNSANQPGLSLTPAGALYHATLAGAQVLQLDDRIGNLAVGKDADFVVIDYRKADPLLGNGTYNRPEQILSRLCYNGDTQCVKDVYMRGIQRYGRSES